MESVRKCVMIDVVAISLVHTLKGLLLDLEARLGTQSKLEVCSASTPGTVVSLGFCQISFPRLMLLKACCWRLVVLGINAIYVATGRSFGS